MMDFYINRFFGLAKSQHRLERRALKQVKQEGEIIRGSAAAIEEGVDGFLEAISPGWELLDLYQRLAAGVQDKGTMESLFAQFKAIESEISTPQWEDLWSHLHNAAAKLVNDQTPEMEELVMELLEMGIQHGAVESKGISVRFALAKNYTELACRMGRADQAAQFLDVIDGQAPQNGDVLFTFCRAIILFSRRKFEACERLLNKINLSHGLSDLYFQTGFRFLKAKAAFELGDFEGAESGVESLKQFLHQNHQFPQYHRKILLLRINFFQRLLRLEFGSKPKPDRLVRSLIDSNVEDKEWFLSKAKKYGNAT